jgi:hypothetical protein
MTTIKFNPKRRLLLVALFFRASIAGNTIANVVPTCAQQCLAASIQTTFQPVCNDTSDISCLCSKYDTQGYTLGELGLKCLYSSFCGPPVSQTVNQVFYICNSTSNAARPTHKTVTATANSNGAVYQLMSPTPNSNSSQPTMPTIILVTSAPPSNSAVSQDGLKGIYIAGIVIGTIAILMSTIAMVVCLLCLRRRRKQLGMKSFKDYFPILGNKYSMTSSTSTVSSDLEEATPSDPEKPQSSSSIEETASCWPKYYRISPPPHTRPLPATPAPAKIRQISSQSSPMPNKQARPQLHVMTAQHKPRKPVSTILNPLHQHPISTPPQLDTKGKGKAINDYPEAPPKSPLRASRQTMTYPFPGMRAGSVVSTTGSTHRTGHHRTASSSVYSEQPSRSSTVTRKASQSTRPDSTTSKKSHRSHGSQKSHRSRSRRKEESTEGQFSALTSIPTTLDEQPPPIVPAPPLPHPRTRSAHPRKSSSQQRVQAKIDQKNNHVRWESGTDFELSDCEDSCNESDPKSVGSSGRTTKESLDATESTSPIADVRYPKIPRGSNSRTPNPTIIPRASVISTSSYSSLHSHAAAADRSMSSTPSRKSKRGSTRTPSRSSTPSTSKTATASPKTPKSVGGHGHGESRGHFSQQTPTIIISSTPPPAHLSGTPLLYSGEFLQHPAFRHTGTWPRSSKAQSEQLSAQQLDNSVKIARKDLPQSAAVYDFF